MFVFQKQRVVAIRQRLYFYLELLLIIINRKYSLTQHKKY